MRLGRRRRPFGKAAGIRRSLDHDRWNGPDHDCRFDSAFTMSGNVAHDLAPASGMADVDRVLKIELRRERGEIIGVMIHVVPRCRLC